MQLKLFAMKLQIQYVLFHSFSLIILFILSYYSNVLWIINIINASSSHNKNDKDISDRFLSLKISLNTIWTDDEIMFSMNRDEIKISDIFAY